MQFRSPKFSSKMRNIKLTIAYDGACYAGWQIQRNAKTIQGEIEKALKKIFGKKVRLVGAGRTDSGVHAKAQTANFTVSTSEVNIRFQDALNSKLPNDIRVLKAEKAAPEFHSRYSARGKIYRYTILNSKIDDPFLHKFYHKVPYKLDTALMRREAKILEGKRDFRAFQAKSNLSRVKNTKRTVKKLTIKKDGSFIYIDIEADGFLHNMARNIAGTLIEIGRGHFPAGSMKKILTSKDRRLAGPTAPAKGLTLVKVKY